MPLRGCNNQFYHAWHKHVALFPSPALLHNWVLTFRNFFLILALPRTLTSLTWKHNKFDAAYAESLERKRSCLISLPLLKFLIKIFPSFYDISLRAGRSIFLWIVKIDRDLPHVSALYNWVSTGNGPFVFCNRRLEILVADMMFDEICTARSPVCLCLLTSALVFTNGEKITSSISGIPYFTGSYKK